MGLKLAEFFITTYSNTPWLAILSVLPKVYTGNSFAGPPSYYRVSETSLNIICAKAQVHDIIISRPQ